MYGLHGLKNEKEVGNKRKVETCEGKMKECSLTRENEEEQRMTWGLLAYLCARKESGFCIFCVMFVSATEW